MESLLSSVDKWFLILAVMLLGLYFLWSVRSLFTDLKQSIQELKDTIKELFNDRNDHEGRIKVLETRISVCEACNGNLGHHHERITDKEKP